MIIVDAKEHLSLDAQRNGNGFVKKLVNPLDSEERLCWETLEYALENFDGGEDSVACFAAFQIVLCLKFGHSVSILVGVLVLLSLCQQSPSKAVC